MLTIATFRNGRYRGMIGAGWYGIGWYGTGYGHGLFCGPGFG
jgi:hypothetical protein